MYPPSVVDAPVKMSYPPGVPPEHQMAIGQEVYGLLPGLGMYATLWLREHNRVCDILKAEHPTWDDEQLFQTTRLIIIGEQDTSLFSQTRAFTLWFLYRSNKQVEVCSCVSFRCAGAWILFVFWCQMCTPVFSLNELK